MNERTNDAGAGARPVRVALITSARTVSDYSSLLGGLLVGLVDQSIGTALVCPNDRVMDEMLLPSVEIIRHPILDVPLAGVANRKVLLERLQEFGPTILHCLCESKLGLTGKLAHIMDIPYLLTVNRLHNRPDLRGLSGRQCAKITVPARSIAINFAALYPRFVERIVQINVGTFVEERVHCFDSPSRIPGIVAAGPENPRDSFESFLGAVKRLAVEGYEFATAVINTARAEKHLRSIVRTAGLSKIVIIVPRFEPLRSILAAGDIYVQPQPAGYFNPLLLEAMSTGSAVAACMGGVDDMLIEGKTCVTFKSGDEIGIHNRLRELLDRREFARELAQNAQAYLKENHSVSAMIAQVLEAYRQAEQWYGG